MYISTLPPRDILPTVKDEIFSHNLDKKLIKYTNDAFLTTKISLINNLDHTETYSSYNNTWHKGYPSATTAGATMQA